MPRLVLAHELFRDYLSSKLNVFDRIPILRVGITKIRAEAGLFKPNSFLPEHGVLLSNLTGMPYAIKLNIHGKRRRRTVSVKTEIRKNFI
jgi:hypothetical protein